MTRLFSLFLWIRAIFAFSFKDGNVPSFKQPSKKNIVDDVVMQPLDITTLICRQTICGSFTLNSYFPRAVQSKV